MTTAPFAAISLDERFRKKLWERIERRLAEGESLATQGRLLHALENEYQTMIGVSASGGALADLDTMVRSVCQTQPERYLARGVQNAVEQAFISGVHKLKWRRLTVRRHGFAAVDGFLRRQRVRSFLADIRLDPALIDIAACVLRGEAALSTPDGTSDTRKTASATSPPAPAADVSVAPEFRQPWRPGGSRWMRCNGACSSHLLVTCEVP